MSGLFPWQQLLSKRNQCPCVGGAESHDWLYHMMISITLAFQNILSHIPPNVQCETFPAGVCTSGACLGLGHIFGAQWPWNEDYQLFLSPIMLQIFLLINQCSNQQKKSSRICQEFTKVAAPPHLSSSEPQFSKVGAISCLLAPKMPHSHDPGRVSAM